MRISTMYDIRMSKEEYEVVNEIYTLGHYLFGFGAELRLLMNSDDYDNLISALEDYLYNEDSIRGSETYEIVSGLCYKLNEVYYN